MGRNTVAALIARAQNMNSYNNSGISTTAMWVDAFNAALQDLAPDIGLQAQYPIPYEIGTTAYDLPTNYFEVDQLTDSGSYPLRKREHLNQPFPLWDSYYIYDAGANYKIDFGDRNSNENLILNYTRYPDLLAVTDYITQKPEVPTIGEDALIYFAISRGLRNNNQPGQAMELERMYEVERKKIRDAKYRAIAGW